MFNVVKVVGFPILPYGHIGINSVVQYYSKNWYIGALVAICPIQLELWSYFAALGCTYLKSISCITCYKTCPLRAPFAETLSHLSPRHGDMLITISLSLSLHSPSVSGRSRPKSQKNPSMLTLKVTRSTMSESGTIIAGSGTALLP